MGRSILAVLLGYVAALVLLALAYLVLARWFPDDVPRYGVPLVIRPVAAMTALCACFGAVGALITVRFAARRPFQHALALVVTMVILGLVKPLLAPAAEPLASHLTFLTGLACGALLGGKIASKQANKAEIAA